VGTLRIEADVGAEASRSRTTGWQVGLGGDDGLDLVAVLPGVLHAPAGVDPNAFQAGDMLQSVLDHLGLELQLRVIVDVLELASPALVVDRAAGHDPADRWLEDPTNPASSVVLLEFGDLNFNLVAWSPAGYEDDEVLHASDSFSSRCQVVNDDSNSGTDGEGFRHVHHP